MRIFIVLSLLVATATMEEYEEFNEVLAADCSKYSEDWRIAKCASSQREMRLISKYTFNKYLDLARKTDAPYNKYYSIGITAGLDRRLVAGIQHEPSFETTLSFSYDPASYYYDRVLLDWNEVELHHIYNPYGQLLP